MIACSFTVPPPPPPPHTRTHQHFGLCPVLTDLFLGDILGFRKWVDWVENLSAKLSSGGRLGLGNTGNLSYSCIAGQLFMQMLDSSVSNSPMVGQYCVQ